MWERVHHVAETTLEHRLVHTCVIYGMRSNPPAHTLVSYSLKKGALAKALNLFLLKNWEPELTIFNFFYV